MQTGAGRLFNFRACDDQLRRPKANAVVQAAHESALAVLETRRDLGQHDIPVSEVRVPGLDFRKRTYSVENNAAVVSNGLHWQE